MVHVSEGIVVCEGEGRVGAAETPEDGACLTIDKVHGTGIVARYEVVAGSRCVERVDVAGL